MLVHCSTDIKEKKKNKQNTTEEKPEGNWTKFAL